MPVRHRRPRPRYACPRRQRCARFAAGGRCRGGGVGVLGVVIGSLAGFTGGKIDEFFMRVAEAFQIVPQFFLAILVVALFGASLTKIVLVIAILSWPPPHASSARNS
jgi:ABC-type dipeptide/oligopeptide/nickel transport system permease subunit